MIFLTIKQQIFKIKQFLHLSSKATHFLSFKGNKELDSSWSDGLAIFSMAQNVDIGREQHLIVLV